MDTQNIEYLLLESGFKKSKCNAVKKRHYEFTLNIKDRAIESLHKKLYYTLEQRVNTNNWKIHTYVYNGIRTSIIAPR